MLSLPSSLLLSILILTAPSLSAPAPAPVAADDGMWHPAGQAQASTWAPTAATPTTPGWKAPTTTGAGIPYSQMTVSAVDGVTASKVTTPPVAPTVAPNALTPAATGDWQSAVVWPAGCEKWANPCPAGAHTAGGTATYENAFTSYTTLTDANGVITGMPPKATIAAGVTGKVSNSTTLATKASSSSKPSNTGTFSQPSSARITSGSNEVASQLKFLPTTTIAVTQAQQPSIDPSNMAESHKPPPGPHTPAPLQPSRSPPNSLTHPPPSPSLGSHRPSLTENLRANPTSPRTPYRSPSLSQQTLQELMNNPPTMSSSQGGAGKSGKSEFAGRDWRDVKVGEVVDEELVRWVEMETSVEEATNVLIASGSPNVVLLRENRDTHAAIGTFDYTDLNSYLLLVVGLAQPEDRQSFKELAQKGREGRPIPLKDVKDLGKKEPLITLAQTASLTKAAEIFGSGIHRIIVVKDGTREVVGVLTQLRMVRFFWENGRHFESIERLYQATLRDLDIGSKEVFAINGDKPLTDALELMNNEGITSLPVVDHQQNVIGNISHVDVRLLTKNTALPLLRSSCIHFISVILSERGVTDGKDSYPVFHVSPFSTLAHTTAKLVATRSHRMWVVQPSSPASSSGPPTPALAPSTPFPPFNASSSDRSSSFSSPLTPSAALPSTTIPPQATPPNATSTASQIQSGMQHSHNMSGRLSGVVSLTDILNLFAKASGLNPHDPSELRQLRRRSSSASNTRRSISSARSESIGGGSSVAGSRRGSQSSRRPVIQSGGPGGTGSAVV
ncbi:hypothetical protein FKW77_001994 [Venturia effusa]|uniref:CBS domain-containing protein n=1 Tax=Venturia effusa TaxID=50376 RepID=A0A517L6R0_9PEZI|nr:hypothetical protein FKW77_001994 [Venturia effusa]